MLRPIKSLAKHLKCFASNFSKFGVEMEPPVDLVSTFFSQEFLQDHLHVIVQVPAGKYHISASSIQFHFTHLFAH
jgi:hypothetical protein